MLSIIAAPATAQKRNTSLLLEIQGATDVDTQTLQNYNYATTFSALSLLKNTVDTLSSQLTYDGYFDLQSDVKKKNDSFYTATFTLGNKYERLSLAIKKDSLLTSYALRSGFPITEEGTIEIETAFAKAYLQQLTTIAANNGNPFASFKISELSKKDTKTLEGTLLLQTNEYRTIDKVTVKGYKTISKSFLKYYAGFKSGIPFNKDKLTEQSESLATLPFVEQTKNPDVLFTKDSTTIYLYLKRNNINTFDGFLGFATDQRNNLQLDGYLDLLLINNFNYGERFALNYKADGNDQSQLAISASLPYLLKTPLGLEAELKLFRKDSTFSTTEQSINLFYQLTRKSAIALGYDALQSEDLAEAQNTATTNFEDYTASQLTATFSYLKRSTNSFFPVARAFSFKAGFGERKATTETQDQFSIEAILENNFILNPTNSIYLRSTSNYLVSDNYFTNELYRFGGILSIRGFEENSIFANLYSTLNTEYRYQLSNSIYVNSVVDFGYFENDIEGIKQSLYSVGLGTGIRTKAGVLKINLANGIFEEQSFQFSNTKLHIILQVSF